MRYYEEFCHRICGIMRKSIISPAQCYGDVIRHYGEYRRRICVNMLFSSLFMIRRYTIVARQLYVTVRKNKIVYTLICGFPGFSHYMRNT